MQRNKTKGQAGIYAASDDAAFTARAAEQVSNLRWDIYEQTAEAERDTPSKYRERVPKEYWTASLRLSLKFQENNWNHVKIDNKEQ